MKQLNEQMIIGVDHGYGNIKTANHCFKTGILGYDNEPLFTGDMLTYGGRYYLIGEGHKEFIAEKIRDEDYYLLTLVAIAKELKDANLTEANIVLAAGLPLTWTSGQKKEFAAYLNKGSRRGKHARTTVWGKLLICECGHTFNTRRWDRPDRQPGNAYQCYSSVHTGSYESRKKKGLPLEGICRSPMVPEWRLQMMANLIFRKYLSEKDKVLALANSMLEGYNENADEDRKTKETLETKQRELTRLQKRMDNLIEMRADGDLSREMFRLKSDELEPKMQKLQKDIEELSAKQEPKVITNYAEKLTVLQYALSQYTSPQEGEDVPESVIEAFVVKIVVSKDGFDWYLRFDGDPNKPRHCTVEGKRRSTTKIMVSQDFSPALDSSTTGCYQGLMHNPKPGSRFESPAFDISI